RVDRSLLDNLIGHMRPVIVARFDVVHASGNRLSKNSNCSVNVPWRSPNFRASKLHRAVAHPVQAGCGAWECEGATEFRLSPHLCLSSDLLNQFGDFAYVWLAEDLEFRI